MVLEAKRLLLREMNPDDYASEGMALGMCFGVALSTALHINVGLGLMAGMVLGLLVGSEIKKKSDNDKGGKTE